MAIPVALRVREWREKRGLSLRQLGDKAGVGFVSIARIEHRRMSPTVDMLAKLADALDVEIRDFFEPRKKRRAVNPKRRR